MENEKERLLSRMRAIEELQGNRPLIVRFFDELVDLKARFISGPFKSFAFEIINKNKNYFITKINNFKITVKKKDKYFLPL